MATGKIARKYTTVKTKNSENKEVYLRRNDGDRIKRLYWGDNIDALSILNNDPAISGHVSLVYIDPPYNSGFDYCTKNDEFAYGDKYLTEDYLVLLKTRLKLLHDLLSPSGTIYLQLDDKMVFDAKLILDDIFGKQRFRSFITRKKCQPKNTSSTNFGNISDYILVYSKTDNPIWNRPFCKWDDTKILKEYPFIEAESGRRYKKVPIHAPGIRNGETGKPWRGMLPPIGKHWQYTPEKLEQMDRDGLIFWSSKGNPRRKVYLDESQGCAIQDIWLDYVDVKNQNTELTGYPTEKNLDMLKLIIEASSNPDDIILDCFCGSGTTLLAAELLNRQWIGVDKSDLAIKTTQSRMNSYSFDIIQLIN
ncbi:site-specific DNA-methyltransferase [Candidatus Saccharibacteria bacterium]|nr:site-specific DNA-methyltransferase [Candidatus Saccharibacteria bacterium]